MRIADVYYDVWTVPHYVKVIYTILSLSNKNTFKWNKDLKSYFKVKRS